MLTFSPFISELQMWETAGKAGVITANLMWFAFLRTHKAAVHNAKQISFCQARPTNHNDRRISDLLRTLEGKHTSGCLFVTYFLIFALQNHVSLKVKLDQIVNWIDLPLEKRPQLIMGMFV